MTYEEKLDITVQAIREARQFTRKDYFTKLHLGVGNGLTRIRLAMLYDILLQLQDDEKIIVIKELPTKLKRLVEQTSDALDGSKNYFLIDILDDFDDWYENHLLKEKSRLKNLSKKNFDNIACIVFLIEEELELAQSNKLTISFITNHYELEGYDSLDVQDIQDTYTKSLNYLKNIGVIKKFSGEPMALYSEITLNITKFLEVLKQIKNLKSKNHASQSQKTTVKKTNKKDRHKLFYDKKKRTLKIGNKTVRFQRDSFRVKVLELLLDDENNRKKEWSWDEVIDEIQGTEDSPSLRKENKKKFYPACDGLSKHIAQKIGVNDLLIYTKSTVQINPKYL